MRMGPVVLLQAVGADTEHGTQVHSVCELHISRLLDGVGDVHVLVLGECVQTGTVLIAIGDHVVVIDVTVAFLTSPQCHEGTP